MSYKRDFFEQRHDRTVSSAELVLRVVWDLIGPIRSAVDVGCGVGTWLAVLKNYGASDVVGVDGRWVDPALLRIPHDHFVPADLSQPDALSSLLGNRTFDLGISLEVAEHLPRTAARKFISELARLSGCVLFSAAIPGQGGVNHLNEQWPDYWVTIFREYGFVPFDLIRPRIWQDRRVGLAYRQNALLFVSQDDERLPKLKAQSGFDRDSMLSVVHPDLWSQAHKPPSVRRALVLLRGAIVRSVFSRFGARRRDATA